ncbi:MAG: DEAD/DEAH box helicase [Gammaproteobacteria bacterium]
MSFKDLGLSDPILRALKKLDHSNPTEIQSKAIPLILAGKSIMASAQTGSGKTAGFVLPILEQLKGINPPKSKNVNVLILVPTRELASQIQDSVISYGSFLSKSSAAVFGGAKIFPQKNKLKTGVDILVATPGRLLDLVNQKAVYLDQVKIAVLDEADRMLDMGFLNDIKKILNKLPSQRQSLMFSATFSSEIKNLAKELSSELVEVMTSTSNETVESITQKVYAVDKEAKPALLGYLINEYGWNQVLVFSRTKHGTEKIAKKLKSYNIEAITIHGDKTQGARTRALKDFKSQKAHVLVATDVAARGIDIANLPFVVNFDLPAYPNDYVHRIGRTGRAGKEGIAVSFMSAEERNYLKEINHLTKLSLEPEIVEGFTPTFDLNASKETKKPKRSRFKRFKKKIFESKKARTQNSRKRQKSK